MNIYVAVEQTLNRTQLTMLILIFSIESIPPIKTRSFGIVYNKPRHGEFLGITLRIVIATHEMNFF